MAKLTRIFQNIFASTAVAGQVAKFGSLAAGTPVTTTDPAVIQSLSNWLDGWSAAVMGGNSPAIEDRNAVDLVVTRQLAYLLQTGVPEWDATTVYYIGSIVNDGTGGLYVSLTDANTNNALTSSANWRAIAVRTIRAVAAADVAGATNDRFVEMSPGAADHTYTFPAAASCTGQQITITKMDAAAGQVLFAGSASGTPLLGQYDSATFISNGAIWYQV